MDTPSHLRMPTRSRPGRMGVFLLGSPLARDTAWTMSEENAEMVRRSYAAYNAAVNAESARGNPRRPGALRPSRDRVGNRADRARAQVYQPDGRRDGVLRCDFRRLRA